mmetsp:Transcript_32697/g.66350  ORF Transcript_32697/g.66350 Transcript_32697/m.66350 type:complete len:202 (+) Transcript_32697:186-791(+)
MLRDRDDARKRPSNADVHRVLCGRPPAAPDRGLAGQPHREHERAAHRRSERQRRGRCSTAASPPVPGLHSADDDGAELHCPTGEGSPAYPQPRHRAPGHQGREHPPHQQRQHTQSLRLWRLCRESARPDMGRLCPEESGRHGGLPGPGALRRHAAGQRRGGLRAQRRPVGPRVRGNGNGNRARSRADAVEGAGRARSAPNS